MFSVSEPRYGPQKSSSLDWCEHSCYTLRHRLEKVVLGTVPGHRLQEMWEQPCPHKAAVFPLHSLCHVRTPARCMQTMHGNKVDSMCSTLVQKHAELQWTSTNVALLSQLVSTSLCVSVVWWISPAAVLSCVATLSLLVQNGRTQCENILRNPLKATAAFSKRVWNLAHPSEKALIWSVQLFSVLGNQSLSF